MHFNGPMKKFLLFFDAIRAVTALPLALFFVLAFDDVIVPSRPARAPAKRVLVGERTGAGAEVETATLGGGHHALEHLAGKPVSAARNQAEKADGVGDKTRGKQQRAAHRSRERQHA